MTERLFAEVSPTNQVLRVLVAPSDVEDGNAFFGGELGLSGTWIECWNLPRDLNPRVHPAGPGMTYDPTADVFYYPQPHPSWSLDENWEWQAPIPYPGDNGLYDWDEDTLSWVEVTA